MLQMSKLYVLCVVLALHCSRGMPQPDRSNAILAGGKSTSPSALPPSNAATSEEIVDIKSTDDSYKNNNDEESEQPPPAAPSSLAISAGKVGVAEASTIVVSHSLGNAQITAVQHHILPAEKIPLPIMIATRPGIRTVIAPERVVIHKPTITKVGEVIQKIPTAVSHHSQTIVHKHAHIVTPIVAPAVRTITSQVVRAYHIPLVYAPHAPLVRLVTN